ncbi:aminotransferase class V-fold PLP-dependent enzyme [Mesoplasma corruscae]|uniref:cysteine desulfurase n=1 Tax=Mesoplasma corruscae TaxID=216874 RepID=A0A2S5RGK1_9MOLU|nr:aminotransferase class V-fold PLP-dependent enzyme [Mesoplasma corruscae]PPE06421.1 cysteine desulfurase [Mesoplasma corruscae]
MNKKIKNLFPFFKNNPEKVYFDSAASTLKLSTVIEAERDFLTTNGANPHVTDYEKGFEALEKLNYVRSLVRNMINAYKTEEVIFTSGTTQSINTLANGIAEFIKKDDEILLTELEHSSNMMPWINLVKNNGAKIKKISLADDFTIDISDLKNQINKNTKIITISHVTNTLGTKNDIATIVKVVKNINPEIIIHVDCAQSIAHEVIDVQNLGVDFISFSTHKIYSSFGLGVLWGKYDLLDKLKPFLFGGGMNLKIDSDFNYKLKTLPDKLEGGTPNIQAIYGFEQAIKFINEIKLKNIISHETSLKKYFVQKVNEKKLNCKIDFYNLNNNSPIILFNVKGVNPQDITTFLDKKYNILARGGANCARRINGVIGVEIAVRISFAIYNTFEEVDILIEALSNSEDFLSTII